MQTYVPTFMVSQFFLEWGVLHESFSWIRKYILYSKSFFLKNLVVYKVMWKNMVMPESTDDNEVRRKLGN